MVLNLGCGELEIPGTIGVDIVKTNKVKVITNFDKDGLPFKSGSISKIHAYHILEHLDLVPIVEEIYRILCKGGIAVIKVPHASSFGFWDDPTHKRAFTSATFDYWSAASPFDYGFMGSFKIKRKRLHFLGNPEVNQFYKYPLITNSICKGIDFLANQNIRLCERLWAHFVGGFGEVEFILEKD